MNIHCMWFSFSLNCPFCYVENYFAAFPNASFLLAFISNKNAFIAPLLAAAAEIVLPPIFGHFDRSKMSKRMANCKVAVTLVCWLHWSTNRITSIGNSISWIQLGSALRSYSMCECAFIEHFSVICCSFPFWFLALILSFSSISQLCVPVHVHANSVYMIYRRLLYRCVFLCVFSWLQLRSNHSLTRLFQ